MRAKQMRSFRLKKVITTKGQTMWYLGDGLWFGRTSKADAELGLATGQYVLWEVVDHRPQPEIQEESESISQAAETQEEVKAESESIEPEKTDAEVIDIALEAVGLMAEFGDKTVEKYGHLVNVDIARRWIEANSDAESKLADYKNIRIQVEDIRKQIRPIRERLMSEGVRSMQDRENHLDMATLKQKERELMVACNEKYSLYDQAFDTAWNLGKQMISDEPPQKKEKIQKDYKRLSEYWERKIDSIAYKLDRATGALTTAQRNHDRVLSSGSELSKYFHLGTVGGSGRNVKKLNRRRSNDVDRILDSLNVLNKAKARVGQLQSTLERYQTNYEKAYLRACSQGVS